MGEESATENRKVGRVVEVGRNPGKVAMANLVCKCLWTVHLHCPVKLKVLIHRLKTWESRPGHENQREK